MFLRRKASVPMLTAIDVEENNDELVDRDVESDVECADLIEELEAEPAAQPGNWPWRSWFFYVIAILAAFSAAIYAFLEPSHSSVDDVSEQWWDEMPVETQVLSVAMAVNTQIVNTIFFSFFIESAFLRCKDSMAVYFASCKNFTVNTSHILLSSCAALANGAIAYQSYLWLPESRISAIFPSTLNTGVTFASRYVGLHNLTGRISDLFDRDARLQKQCLISLQHIHPAFQDQMNAFLANKPVNEETLRDLLQVLSEQEGSVIPVSTREKCQNGSGLAFDLVFFLFVLVSTFLLFGQKGYNGVELLSDNALSDAHPAEKILTGVLPGLVSSVFMALNALEFRQVILDLFVHVRRHPLHIPLVITALIMNAVSAGVGWKNIAISTISPANIFSITSIDTPLAQAYIYLNVAGSFVTSFKAMGQKIVDSKEPPTELERLITWTQKNKMSSSTADQLRRYSLFRSKAETSTSPPADPELAYASIEI